METKQNHLEQVRVLNEDIDKCFENSKELLQNDKFQDVIDSLLLLEKRSRILIEPFITRRIAKYIIELYHDYKSCNELCASLVMLSKRRSQSDDVILELVRQCTPYLDEYKTEDAFKLINTLLDISEGKMNIENERTHLILRLVKMKEEQNDIQGAALTSQEITVEVCNTLTPREKAEFLLEQIRLSQLTGDYFRVPIYISKMNLEILNQSDMEDVKEKYIDLCIKQHIYDNDLFSLYKDYEYSLTLSQYTTLKGDSESLMAEKDRKKADILTYLCLCIILSNYSEEQSLLLNQLLSTYNTLLESQPIYHQLLIQFNTCELISWPISNLKVIYNHSLFTSKIFSSRSEEWKNLLRIRVIQHNIRVISKLFVRGRISRFSELLQLTPEETQHYITELVDQGIISLKINQLTNIVEFKATKSTDSILNEWSSHTSEIMNLVDKTSLLIEKEHMMQL